MAQVFYWLAALGVCTFAFTAGGVRAGELAPSAANSNSLPIWTGFFTGWSAQAKWSDATWTTTSVGDDPSLSIDASSPRTFNPFGGGLGTYAGYNWQIQQTVLGIEGRAALGNARETTAGIPGCSIACTADAPGPGMDTSTVETKWDAGISARLGYLIRPDLLLYGTGGVEWQRVTVAGFCQHTIADPQCYVLPDSSDDRQTNNHTLTGWSIGGGVEKMYGNLMLRGEYRFARFGKERGALNFRPGSSGLTYPSDIAGYNLDLETHTLSAGIAYKY